jgi:diguanylate cyclase (GGDEF)-like protein
MELEATGSVSARDDHKASPRTTALPAAESGSVTDGVHCRGVSRRIMQVLFTNDRRQRIRLTQSGLANILMLACVAMAHVLDRDGVMDRRFLWPWTFISVGFMASVFLVIRSGLVLHWRDPSLTMVQMLFAVVAAATSYCIGGTQRADAIPILAVVLMFGMFNLTPVQTRVVALCALAAFGSGSLYWLLGPGAHEPPGQEVVRFLMVGIVVMGVVALSGTLHGMRTRSRQHRNALAAALDRIRESATRDDLTGCLNRRAMFERIAEASTRRRRSEAPICLALIDLDHFKRINDVHGHAAGDEVLRAFAELTRVELQDVDLVARWGGEEFLLMFPNSHLSEAALCVRRLLASVASARFVALPADYCVTCSAGVTALRENEGIIEALDRADKALYRAKDEGRNRSVTSDS